MSFRTSLVAAIPFVAAATLIIVSGLSAAFGQETGPAGGIEAVIEQRVAGNRDNAAVQQRIDALDDETQRLLAEYRRLLGQIEALETYVAQVEALIADQEAELSTFEARRAAIADTERRILPLMQAMTDHLERFILADTPFLRNERLDRVAQIRDVLARADVSTSEKFRLLIEAYQIEVDYGRNFEAYQGSLAAAGDQRVVDFLRVGRVALIYRTLDGAEAAIWSPDDNAWQPLPARYERTLEDAFRVARQQAAPQLLILPAPAAETGPAIPDLPLTGDQG